MDTNKLTPAQRQQRSNVRNFLLTATLKELVKESTIGDKFRQDCVHELIDEIAAETVNNFIEDDVTIIMMADDLIDD